MRTVAALLVFSASLWAQRAVSPSGYGRILFPGGTAPSNVAPSTAATGFGRMVYPGQGAPAVTRSPRNNYGVGGFAFVGGPPPLNDPPKVGHPNHNQPIVVPYPVYVGGGYPGYYEYEPPQAQLINNYVPSANPQQEPPVVIVNQYFRPDQAPNQVTQAAPLQAAPVPVPAPQVTATNPDKDTIFLIAMKDHTIYAANAYWVEDNTLNYVTIQGSENSVSLDLVDRELSQRLNRDRRVAFGLPR